MNLDLEWNIIATFRTEEDAEDAGGADDADDADDAKEDNEEIIRGYYSRNWKRPSNASNSNYMAGRRRILAHGQQGRK